MENVARNVVTPSFIPIDTNFPKLHRRSKSLQTRSVHFLATVVTLAKRRVKRPLHECCKIPHTRLLPCGCFSCQFAEGEKSLQRPIKERGKGRKISENPSRKIVGAVVSLDYRRTEQRRSPGQPRETVTAPIKFSI